MINKVFAAMDFSGFDEFKKNYDKIKRDISLFKIGYQLFYSDGERVLKFLKNEGKKVFLDLKFDDIPNTMEKGFLSLAKKYSFHFFTVHIGSGIDGLKKLSKIGKDHNVNILGVTLLTGLNTNDLILLNSGSNLHDLLNSRIQMAIDSEIEGIVMSASDLKLRLNMGDLIKVTPGIRYKDDSKNDQKRTATPKEAFENGADYIVMGRSLFSGGTEKLLKNIGD